ncbi:CD276 antigen-like isoform X2 [Amblyraja radiata]|nr:CD276 antigen-like isoform X2 [Amblyraja radiata]
MDISFELKCCLFFILFASTHSVEKFMTFKCESPVRGEFNVDTKLRCSLKTTGISTFTTIKLLKDDKPLFTYDTREHNNTFQGQIELHHLDNASVTLIIQQTKPSNGGMYHCIIYTDQGHDSADIELVFKAPYSSPNMTLLEESISCETMGYPPAQIHWMLNGEINLTNIARTDRENTTEGLFIITSKLPLNLSKDNREDIYTCSVWNEAEGRIEVKTFSSISNLVQPSPEPIREEKKKTVLTAVYVIIGALLSGILILGLYQLRKRHSPDQSHEPEYMVGLISNIRLIFNDLRHYSYSFFVLLTVISGTVQLVNSIR